MNGCLGFMATVVGLDVAGRLDWALCSTSTKKMMQRQVIILLDK